MVGRRRIVVGLSCSGLVAASVATRLASTIYYVEDTDSLRFALSVSEGFDLVALQPHFPGYPVFWAAAGALYQMTGSFAASFSLVGGLATAAVVIFGIRLSGRDPLSAEGLAIGFLLFFNPMIWLMGNRYMPDLMGLAAALAALSLFTAPHRRESDRTGDTLPPLAAAGFLTGLLAGIRLSYAPLLLPAYLHALVRWRARRAGRLLALTLAGSLIWFVPMAADTGWDALLDAATQQTEGHFTEFGGTVETDPHLAARAERMFEAVWSEGLGAWWRGRHPLTALVAVGLLLSAIEAVRAGTSAPGRSLRRTTAIPLLLTASVLTYAIWIYFFQNVIYKSRHVLPLVAFACIPLGIGLARLARGEAFRTAVQRAASRLIAGVFAVAYATVTLVLVVQHREPTAIAQIKEYVEETRPETIVSIPLVNFYLSAQNIEADFLSIQDPADRARLDTVGGSVMVIGRFPEIIPQNSATADTFYHNPYVNRMWAEVEVHVHDQ